MAYLWRCGGDDGDGDNTVTITASLLEFRKLGERRRWLFFPFGLVEIEKERTEARAASFHEISPQPFDLTERNDTHREPPRLVPQAHVESALGTHSSTHEYTSTAPSHAIIRPISTPSLSPSPSPVIGKVHALAHSIGNAHVLAHSVQLLDAPRICLELQRQARQIREQRGDGPALGQLRVRCGREALCDTSAPATASMSAAETNVPPMLGSRAMVNKTSKVKPRQAGGKRAQMMSPALLGRQEAPTQTLPAVVTLQLTALSPEAGAPLISYLEARREQFTVAQLSSGSWVLPELYRIILPILAEAHALDEHPAHQGHTPVLYRLSDVCQGPMHVIRLPLCCKQLPTVHQPVGGQEAEVTHPLDCWRAGHSTAKPGGCLSIHTPYSPPLFLRALLGRLKGGEVLVQPNPSLTETGSKVKFQHCTWTIAVKEDWIAVAKQGRITHSGAGVAGQGGGNPKSWVAESRILPEQRQDALKEGLCSRPCQGSSEHWQSAAGVEKETPVRGAHFSYTRHRELVRTHEHTSDLQEHGRFVVADQKEVDASWSPKNCAGIACQIPDSYPAPLLRVSCLPPSFARGPDGNPQAAPHTRVSTPLWATTEQRRRANQQKRLRVAEAEVRWRPARDERASGHASVWSRLGAGASAKGERACGRRRGQCLPVRDAAHAREDAVNQSRKILWEYRVRADFTGGETIPEAPQLRLEECERGPEQPLEGARGSLHASIKYQHGRTRVPRKAGTHSVAKSLEGAGKETLNVALTLCIHVVRAPVVPSGAQSSGHTQRRTRLCQSWDRALRKRRRGAFVDADGFDALVLQMRRGRVRGEARWHRRDQRVAGGATAPHVRRVGSEQQRKRAVGVERRRRRGRRVNGRGPRQGRRLGSGARWKYLAPHTRKKQLRGLIPPALGPLSYSSSFPSSPTSSCIVFQDLEARNLKEVQRAREEWPNIATDRS
ncbi:hypothetical protein DFH08DRAFT_802517 [Mycena albidolilacea]|uniref:Uncharacterized protein n=1 Tax=Mycena albidolilacea TaxID=1033008 RepID=A0AAD7AE94_9AGAR|nr:hypothetical protein DFH08DRAFT_802517 [Mycena albidolilacea]